MKENPHKDNWPLGQGVQGGWGASVIGGFQNPGKQSPEQPCLNTQGEGLTQAAELTPHLPRFLLTRVTAWFKMFSHEQHLPLQLIFPAESRNVIVMKYYIQHHGTRIFTSAHFLIKIPIWVQINDAKLWNSYQDSSWKIEGYKARNLYIFRYQILHPILYWHIVGIEFSCMALQ